MIYILEEYDPNSNKWTTQSSCAIYNKTLIMKWNRYNMRQIKFLKGFFLVHFCYLNKTPQAAYFWRNWNAFVRALNSGKSNIVSEVPRWVLYVWFSYGERQSAHTDAQNHGMTRAYLASVKLCLQKHWCFNEANQMVSWSSHWHNYLLIIILFELVCRTFILKKAHVSITYVKWRWFNSVWDLISSN